MDQRYRSHNGSHNNLKQTYWGRTRIHLLRDTPAAYADGASTIAERVISRTGDNIPNPRDVSNTLCRENSSQPLAEGLSDFMWLWTKFLENELTLIQFSDPLEIIDIPVLSGDPSFEKGGSIPCSRTRYDKATGTGSNNPRQQFNYQTGFLDGSSLYGTDLVRSSALRRFDGTGRLKSSPSAYGELLTYNKAGFRNSTPYAHEDPASYFLSGDVRVNENVCLTALHTLFMREHNRLCLELPSRYPDLLGNDESIYQMARKIVGAIIQVITFNEYLPLLLGEGAIPAYKGYREEVEPTISNVFSASAFRLSYNMMLGRRQLGRTPNTSLSLVEACYNPKLLRQLGVDLLLEGRFSQPMSHLNTEMSEEARHYILHYSGGSSNFLDFAALNIQRGRDHGLPDYNTVRESFDLTRIADFADITSSKKIQGDLEKLYQSVDSVDPWIGALCEEPIAGSQVGALNYTILRDQFTRLRDGDRYWYEHDPMLKALKNTLSKVKLSHLLRRNTRIRNVPDKVFQL